MPDSEHLPKGPLYPSPPLSKSSVDSVESLRALEISEGPENSFEAPRRAGRSYSLSGFQFEQDLLPLSLSESIQSGGGQVVKNVGVVKGAYQFSLHRLAGSGAYNCKGMALIIGLQSMYTLDYTALLFANSSQQSGPAYFLHQE